ncbi:hypothetical protein AC482_04615 [miscellaneous Crenarchaeota group-15 archaeon DG-45]|uniref:Uncharacterized protein n=1 Tax=miscellaneous Crenarchaeota group-15 archaeon DG-45 TaxID=1685127 RepID=A0A0M0BNK4_9ARCH|nr:MAG: hypothetical protein AC482_04615 [miscellaneous Crenarchaeota group-15 archaeon DG-45]
MMRTKEGYHDEYGNPVRCYTCGKRREDVFQNRLDKVFDPFDEYDVQYVCLDCRVKVHGMQPEYSGFPREVWVERGWVKAGDCES